MQEIQYEYDGTYLLSSIIQDAAMMAFRYNLGNVHDDMVQEKETILDIHFVVRESGTYDGSKDGVGMVIGEGWIGDGFAIHDIIEVGVIH